MAIELVVPSAHHLPSYVDALRRRWSPNTLRPEVADAELAAIEADSGAFLAAKDDPEGAGPPIVRPDGTTRPRLPSFTRWLWDGEFAGSINVRWQPGTAALPAHVSGHVGYSVVPWKRRRGYATEALALLLAEIRVLDRPGVELPHVDLTVIADNVGSRRVIEANGGVLIERLDPGAAEEAGHGPDDAVLLYRIDLGRPEPGAVPGQAPIEW